ncbi:MAG: tetratricopeptide repeat protein [Elusimicrobia bacterium]|nr:tetratricopeptide repeat protein [Elusimicrobiota bacterium]
MSLRRAAVPLLALLALSGCVATQQDVLGLAQQSDDLKSQIVDLKKTVSSLQANQADLSVQIQQLRSDLAAYSDTVKTSIGNMNQLSTQLNDVAARLSGKVTQLGETLEQAQQKALEAQQQALEAQKAQLEAQGRETEATELLLTAEKRLHAREYAQAAATLEDYLKRFPKGSLNDSATYDLGLAYYELGEWRKAGVQFATIIEKYPKNGQIPGARLRYALCLIRLKKSGGEARAYLESVVRDFPRAPEAKEAARELKRLDAAGRAGRTRRPAARTKKRK